MRLWRGLHGSVKGVGGVSLYCWVLYWLKLIKA